MSEAQNLGHAEKQYDKIGGWLILVAIGLIITPVRLIVFILTDLLTAFSPENWHLLTTPGTEAYHPLWAPILIFELVGNFMFFLFSIIVAIYFFQRDKIAPKMIIIFLLSNLIFVAVDYFIGNLIPFVRDLNNTQSTNELIRIVIGCLIWVPYFLMSKRVKGTFVH